MRYFFLVVMDHTAGGEYLTKVLHRSAHEELDVKDLILRNWYQGATRIFHETPDGRAFMASRPDGSATATISEIKEIPEVHFQFLTSFGYIEEI